MVCSHNPSNLLSSTNLFCNFFWAAIFEVNLPPSIPPMTPTFFRTWALENATYERPCSFSLDPSLMTTLPQSVCPCAFQIVQDHARQNGSIVLVRTWARVPKLSWEIGKIGTHLLLSSLSGKKLSPVYRGWTIKGLKICDKLTSWAFFFGRVDKLASPSWHVILATNGRLASQTSTCTSCFWKSCWQIITSFENMLTN